jgi:hypothetical protein
MLHQEAGLAIAFDDHIEEREVGAPPREQLRASDRGVMAEGGEARRAGSTYWLNSDRHPRWIDTVVGELASPCRGKVPSGDSY